MSTYDSQTNSQLHKQSHQLYFALYILHRVIRQTLPTRHSAYCHCSMATLFSAWSVNVVNQVNSLHEILHVFEAGRPVLANTEAGSLIVSRLMDMKTSMESLQRGLDPLAEALAEQHTSATVLLTTLTHFPSNDEGLNATLAAIASSLATTLSENASLAAATEDVRSSIDALRARLATLSLGVQANVGMLSNSRTMISAELQTNLVTLDLVIARLTATVQSNFTSFIGILASSNAGLKSNHTSFSILLELIPVTTTRAEDQDSTDVLSNLTSSNGTVHSSTEEIPIDRGVTTNTIDNVQARVDQLPDNTTRLDQRRLEVLERSVALMRSEISEILGLVRSMAVVAVPPPYGD
jgi:hypothetical protein